MKLIGIILSAAALIGNLFQGNTALKKEVEDGHGREKALQDKLDTAQRIMAEAEHPDADAVQQQLTEARAQTAAAEQKLAALQADIDAASQAGATLAAAITEAEEVPLTVKDGFVPVQTTADPTKTAGSTAGDVREETSTAHVGEQEGNAPTEQQGAAPVEGGEGGEGAKTE